MKIKTIVVGEYQANCFVVTGNGNGTIVIDPGANPELISSFLSSEKLHVSSYFLTHGHYDHISALSILLEDFPAPVRIHSDDLKWAFSEKNSMPPFYPAITKPEKIQELVPDQNISENDVSLKIIHTPGHTPGCVSILCENAKMIFTGDTLFAGSVGRTDLPGGNPRALQESLKTLSKLPRETIVYTGHGPSTTIAMEMETNYFMQRLSIL